MSTTPLLSQKRSTGQYSRFSTNIYVGLVGEAGVIHYMAMGNAETWEIDQFFEANPELLTQFTDTFISRWDTYPYQLKDGSYNRAHWKQPDGAKLYYPLRAGHIEGHLKGGITLGAYLMNAESITTKIVFDDDSENGRGRLLEIAQDFNRNGIPSQLELSSRGGHLWVHTPPLVGRDARRIGIHLLKERGLTTKDIELYPKQNFLHGDHVGSLVRLPFGKHLKTGQIYGFIDLEGRDLADRRRDQLVIISNPQRLSQEVTDRILAAAPEIKRTFQLDPTRLKRYSLDMPPDERIKRGVSPMDYIGQYVDLDHNGKGLCPFHDDHRQSFKVYDDGWHCFAGCEGNTVIDFYIKWKGYPNLVLPSAEWKQVLYEMMKQLGM